MRRFPQRWLLGVLMLLVAWPPGGPALWAQAQLPTRVPLPDSVGAVAAATTVADPRRPQITRTTLRAEENAATIEFEVALPMRDAAGLQARLARGGLVPRAELEKFHLPTAADWQAVADWLTAEGFTVEPAPAGDARLAVFAHGTVAQAARSFQVTFARVAFAGAEHTSAVTAPSVPGTVAAAVLGVNGLQPHLRPQKHITPARPQSTTGNVPPFLPRQIAKAYGAAGLGYDGTGQTIGIVIDAFPATSDLTSFWTTSGVPQSLNNIQLVQVVAGTLATPSGEESLDTEWSSSIASGATVRVYATVDLSFVHLDQAYQYIYNELPNQPGLHQLSLSYGLGETFISSSQLQTDENYFALLSSAGVTVFAASGDAGSSPNSNGVSGGPTQVEAPASSPHVTAVGGTSITLSATTGATSAETAWSGSGGGVSGTFARPSWQAGAGVPAGTTRTVPDVAAAGNPNTGALVVLNGVQQTFGGTSWGAPTWAGLCAILNQARATSGLPPLGLFSPRLYPLLGTAAFRDITAGSNGVYAAGAGYDLVTGLGTPNVAALLAALTGAPEVATPPTTQETTLNQNAVFTVTAGGTGPFAYQWQRFPLGGAVWTSLTDSSALAGSTTPALAVSGATVTMSGDQFRCVITSALGTATSVPATLLVSVPLVVTTLAGQPAVTGTANGTGAAALFNTPGGGALDAAGNLFVADTNNHVIRLVTPAGVVTTFAGLAGTHGTADGAATVARFYFPSNLAFDPAGNLYVADAGNYTIRKITPAGIVSTLAGKAGSSGSTNGTGTAAKFNYPSGLAVSPANGNIFVADATNDLIRKVTPAGVVTTFAGRAGFKGSTNATGTNARFNNPVDVAADAAGNLYIADAGNHAIRKITSAGVVTTLAGTAGVSGSADGLAVATLFNGPAGVRLDAAGNLLVADTSNHILRQITPTGVVTTLAGTASISGSSDGLGAAARFNSPSNVLVDTLGNYYVIDTNNHTLRRAATIAVPVLQPVTPVPPALLGQSVAFAVTVAGLPVPALQWQRLPAGGVAWLNLADGHGFAGTATAILSVGGLSFAMNGDEFRCVATNLYGSAASPPFVLDVVAPPQITSAPGTMFFAGQVNAFAVTATGTPAPAFTAAGLPAWAALDPGTGVLTGTPPDATGSPFALTLTADNGIAPAATQTFTLTVQGTLPAWLLAHPGAGSATADNPYNGVTNLLNYALGANPPGSSVPNLPVVTTVINPADGKPHLMLTTVLDATAGGITVGAEVSGDLQTWLTGAGNVETVSDTTVGRVRTVVFRDTTPLDAATARFIRLRVTQP